MKQAGSKLTDEDRRQLARVNAFGNDIALLVATLAANSLYDKRWLAIAQTHLQEGFMAMRRAVEQPEQF